MAERAKLKRKSYFVDERALNRAKKALGVKTEAEVIRLAVERVAEMEEFWEFMNKSRRLLNNRATSPKFTRSGSRHRPRSSVR